jgi:hypothetical protein
MKHQPDHEIEIMRRGLRYLADLPPEGRRRAVAYWSSRIEDMPAIPNEHGAQQLDIEEVLPATKAAA